MRVDDGSRGTGWTRRSFLQTSAWAAAGALSLRHAHAASTAFTPTWTSLVDGYRTPDWFRDAKFGIWAHWSAQCVPEAGDWYARNMYIQGHRQYDHHVRTYGHPTKVGFMEIQNRCKKKETLARLLSCERSVNCHRATRRRGEVPPSQFAASPDHSDGDLRHEVGAAEHRQGWGPQRTQ